MPKSETFRKAYRSAKDAGVRYFYWKDKKYTTRSKSESPSEKVYDKKRKYPKRLSVSGKKKDPKALDYVPQSQRYSHGGRTKYRKMASSMGEDSKVVVVTDRFGNPRKLKEKGSRGKSKIKYNKDGSIKKSVRTKGLKRIVTKPKRDSRKTMTNKFRNIIDSSRTSRFNKGGLIQHD